MTKIVDNFDNIYSIINWIYQSLKIKWNIKNKEDIYNYEFFIQIMTRNKDLDKNSQDKSKVILNLYCTGIDWIKKREKLIKLVCDEYKARAYIRLQPKNKEKIIYKIISTASQWLYEKNYNGWDKKISAKSLLNTVYWKYWNDIETYVIDIDFWKEVKEKIKIEKVNEILQMLEGVFPTDKIIHGTIKTVNWYHIITSWFNLHQFLDKTKYLKDWKIIEDLWVKKNNPTLIYANV